MSSFSEKIVHDSAPQRGSFCARRDFLKGMVAAPAFLRVLLAGGFELRLGILYDDAHADALRGARMCVTESERAASLLGGTLTAFELRSSDIANPADVASWISGNKIAAIVAATDATQLAKLLETLETSGVVAVNCGASPDEVPGICRTEVRSVVPPRSLLANAVIWDETVERFGGAQLNDRYRAAYHAPMTSGAWCGWFGVKLLWESAARAASGDKAALLAFLASPRAMFDGHKGDMLRFDTAHVLRQPLYQVKIVNGRKDVVEVQPPAASGTICD